MSKNSYENLIQPDHDWMFIATIIMLLIATGAWVKTYTQAVGASTTSQNIRNMDPTSTEAKPYNLPVHRKGASQNLK